MKVVKLRKVGTSLAVTIPKDIAESLGWERGDQIGIGVTGPKSLQITRK